VHRGGLAPPHGSRAALGPDSLLPRRNLRS